MRDALSLRVPCPSVKRGGTDTRLLGNSGDLKLAFADSWVTRDSDVTMLAMSNSQERDQDDWEELFQATDSKLKLEAVRRIPDAKLDMIIARWDVSV